MKHPWTLSLCVALATTTGCVIDDDDDAADEGVNDDGPRPDVGSGGPY